MSDSTGAPTPARRAPSLGHVVWWSSLSLSLTSLAARIASGSLREAYFTSDLLYLPALFADLTRWGGQLRDWRLTPAPYVFPDLAVYGAARALTPGLEWAVYLAGAIQFVLVAMCARALLARLLPDRPAALGLLGATYLLWLSAGSFVAGASFILPIAMISTHGGAVAGALAVFTLCVKPRGQARLVGTVSAAVISFLCGASDALFNVSCPIALVGSALAYLALRKRRSDAAELPLSWTRSLVSAGCGMGGMFATSFARWLEMERQRGGRAVEWPQRMAALFAPEAADTRWALGVLTSMALIAICLLRSQRSPGLRLLAIWQLIGTFALVGSLVYVGASEAFPARYFVVALNLGMVLLVGAVVELVAWGLEPGRGGSIARTARGWVAALPHRLGVGALAAATVVALAAQLAEVSRGRFSSSLRPTAACVEAAARRERVSTVLSDYWHAKPLTLFSDRRVDVLQVRKDLQPYWWINNRAWYRDRRGFGIIAIDGLPMPRAIKSVGQPQEIERCAGLELYIYRGRARERLERVVRANFERFLRR